MRLSTTSAQRKILFFVSISGYAAWFAGLGEPLDAQALDKPATYAPRVFATKPFPRIASLVLRDPFATASRRVRPAAGRVDVARSAIGPGQLSPSADTLVPDIVPDAQAAAPVAAVRATIAGANPVAYVANGQAMDIVRVGDSLGSRRVVAIDLHGLSLDDGTRLDLPQVFLASPHDSGQRGATFRLEDLRRLIAPLIRAQSQPQDRARASVPAPQSTERVDPETVYPTAGPLPTVDARGLPVGVNPTPDPVDPTPFPDPYPYAPARRI